MKDILAVANVVNMPQDTNQERASFAFLMPLLLFPRLLAELPQGRRFAPKKKFFYEMRRFWLFRARRGHLLLQFNSIFNSENVTGV